MADGANAAATAFCEQQYDRLVGGLALYLGDRAVAEELAQEALLRTFARWERVSQLDAPDAWVWRVAINLANSAFRRRAAERRAHHRMASDDDVRPDDDPTVRITVMRAVAQLPRRQRTVLVLRFYLDLSIQDTAERMGASPDAVRSLTKRAVAALRAGLGSDDPAAAIEEGR